VILGHVEEKRGLSERIRRLEEFVEEQEIWGESVAARKLRGLIASVAPTDATVLILGESGTGKELVARSLHHQGPHSRGPFVPVNMAALPRELAESTLFGHERGAFTGADQPQVGCCEAAHEGTLFLDEIGEMDLALQAKLLRFLQERTVQRVGSSRPRQVNVRVVAATNSDLGERVREARFREDLFYRLNVVPLVVPPLRERLGDVPLLAARFLQRFARKYGKPVRGITRATLTALDRYDWPGNVRQLENLIERLVILGSAAEVGLSDLPPEILGQKVVSPQPAQSPAGLLSPPAPDGLPALPTMEQVERQAIFDALVRTRGNVRDAAKLLGCGQATVYRKIKRYGIVLENLGRTPNEPSAEDPARER
jgi:DNA-binding NtrC family response regulator